MRNERAWRLRSGRDIDHAKYTTSASACSRTQTINKTPQFMLWGFVHSETRPVPDGRPRRRVLADRTCPRPPTDRNRRGRSCRVHAPRCWQSRAIPEPHVAHFISPDSRRWGCDVDPLAAPAGTAPSICAIPHTAVAWPPPSMPIRRRKIRQQLVAAKRSIGVEPFVPGSNWPFSGVWVTTSSVR